MNAKKAARAKAMKPKKQKTYTLYGVADSKDRLILGYPLGSLASAVRDHVAIENGASWEWLARNYGYRIAKLTATEVKKGGKS